MDRKGECGPLRIRVLGAWAEYALDVVTCKYLRAVGGKSAIDTARDWLLFVERVIESPAVGETPKRTLFA